MTPSADPGQDRLDCLHDGLGLLLGDGVIAAAGDQLGAAGHPVGEIGLLLRPKPVEQLRVPAGRPVTGPATRDHYEGNMRQRRRSAYLVEALVEVDLLGVLRALRPVLGDLVRGQVRLELPNLLGGVDSTRTRPAMSCGYDAAYS